jgi:hypothetical protein
MKTFYLFTLLLFLSTIVNGQTPTPLSVELEPYISTGLSNPVGIEFFGDRMYIVEQGGKIRIAENGELLPNIYLNIGTQISQGGEQGLLGLAFDPDFEINHTLYVNYTNQSGNTIIASFISDEDNLFVDINTQTILLTIDQPFSNHNGGKIAFGPDGYLYIGMGDGGSGGDPGDRSQNPQLLLGKMLRIDVTADGYTIPPSNPFEGDATTLDEIWALGLRNPWRFNFDQQTGDLWIGDVGQNQWEEIDFQAAGSVGGENYGWRCYEGFHEFNTSGCGDISNYDFPVFEYNHSNGSCSVTGGYVYRGTDSELLNGVYLFVDYCSGIMWGIGDINEDPLPTYDLGSFGFGNASFGQDENGEMYLAKGNNIFKVVDPCHSQIPELTSSKDTLFVSEGVNYYWYLNNEEISGENNNFLVPIESGDYYCVVENEFGCNIKSNTVPVLGLGLIENEKIEFKVFPNPFKSFITLEGDTQSINKIALTDVLGKMIWYQNSFVSNPVILPVDLKPGIYILTISSKQSGQYATRISKF